MRTPRRQKVITVLIRCLSITLALLLLLPAAPVKATLPPPGMTTNVTIRLNYTPVKKLCVGQSLTLSGTYSVGADPADRVPKSNGQPPTFSPPMIIKPSARLGKITPNGILVHYNSSGSFTMLYTATAPGDEAVIAVLDGTYDNPITFTVVEACQYFAFFYLKVHDNFNALGTKLDETYLFMSPAILRPKDPNDPLSRFQEENAQLNYWGFLNDFENPVQGKVSLTKKNYKSAAGHAQTKFYADPAPQPGDPKGTYSKVIFSLKKDKLIDDSHITVTITGKGMTIDTGFSDLLEKDIFKFFYYSPDPFITKKMDAGGGTETVTIDEMEQLKNYLGNSPGFKCDYDAKVTLTVLGN